MSIKYARVLRERFDVHPFHDFFGYRGQQRDDGVRQVFLRGFKPPLEPGYGKSLNYRANKRGDSATCTSRASFSLSSLTFDSSSLSVTRDKRPQWIRRS